MVGKLSTILDLNQLEEQLNISNQNIAAATANVQAGRAMIREARAQYFPTLSDRIPALPIRGCPRRSDKLSASLTTLSRCRWKLPGSPIYGAASEIRSSPIRSPRSPASPIWKTFACLPKPTWPRDYYELRAQDALKQLLDSTVGAYQEALELNLRPVQSRTRQR